MLKYHKAYIAITDINTPREYIKDGFTFTSKLDYIATLSLSISPYSYGYDSSLLHFNNIGLLYV